MLQASSFMPPRTTPRSVWSFAGSGANLDPNHKLPNFRPPRKFWGPLLNKALEGKAELTKPAPKADAASPSPKGGKGAKAVAAVIAVASAGWKLLAEANEALLLNRPTVYAGGSMSLGGRKIPEPE
ncbi:MAG: hypothetical protein KGI97_02345 [Alphaproteobacteria bacterium]|nr:hypothetical protein [Alphaproteobacteria bacterium]